MNPPEVYPPLEGGQALNLLAGGEAAGEDPKP